MYNYQNFIMEDDYGQFYIIDEYNHNNELNKPVKIIDRIQNKAKPVLVSQINNRILQANDTNALQNTPVFICGLCVFMLTIYNFPIIPIFI